MTRRSSGPPGEAASFYGFDWLVPLNAATALASLLFERSAGSPSTQDLESFARVLREWHLLSWALGPYQPASPGAWAKSTTPWHCETLGRGIPRRVTSFSWWSRKTESG